MNNYTERLQAVLAKEQARNQEWDREYRAIQSRENADLEALRSRSRQQKAVIDSELQALYFEITNGVGLKEGDVIRVATGYGDAKAGDYGIVEKQWRDDEREIDYVTFKLDYGSISIPLSFIYLVVDPDEAALHRLTRLANELKWRKGEYLTEALRSIQDISAEWLARIDAKHA